MIKTTSLFENRSIVVHVTGSVTESAENENIKAFVRADNSIDSILNYQKREEDAYSVDTDIFKLLLPIVRLSHLLPSQELQTIPMMEVFI
jgi:hypothetical protein